MLTKYNLIHVPSGGVDHLLDGVRVRIDHRLTDEQADRLKACGLPYFEEISNLENSPTDGTDESTKGTTGEGESPKRSRSKRAKRASAE
ncbi:hypothetical protein LX87_05191 [Larkinella arboricola]|uniref:Uncharacterized protein n=1 Tax=Larkinella arboricola TaxID=643671 RepID=A0A327WKC1_LARAB|nr:hypothetical protein [Larkinella arboricola]RAJ92223.1 hypothetical protein LX87_05191 [Larkinella arboricola]